MDGRFGKIAMDQISRMTPEQIAQIQNQMQNISPAAMERMRQHMSKMSEADLDNIERRLQNTDPSTLPSVGSTIQARQAHAYQASMRLKNEGNGLFKEGNYMAAAEKYERAKSNLSLFVDKQSCELMMICSLNLANSYLKLEMYPQCITECTEVLKESPQNVKALFRRGQAYMHQKKNSAALTDLKETLQLTANDPAERAIVQQRIDDVEQQMAETSTPDPFNEAPIVEEIPVQQDEGPSGSVLNEACQKPSEVKIQTDQETRQMKEMHSETSSTTENKEAESMGRKLPDRTQERTLPSPHDFDLSPENIKHMSEMFKNNPDLVKQQAERMQNMSQEELDRLSAMTGGSADLKLTPEMMKHAAESISRMDADQLKNLPMMAQKTQTGQSPCRPTASSSASTSSPQTSLSPEMMDMMHTMMQKMSPEDIASMTRMATSEGNPILSGTMPSNPEMMRQCFAMLNTMDEDSLVNMMSSSPMCRNPNQARAMVQQMKKLTPSQMEMLAKTASYVQKGTEAAKAAKQWLLSRTAVICTIVIIIIGVVLRILNIM